MSLNQNRYTAIAVPEKFKFSIKLMTVSNTLLYIKEDYKVSDVYESNTSHKYANPISGLHTWDNIEVFVINVSKQGYIFLHFYDEDSYNLLSNTMINRRKDKQEKIPRKIYRYDAINNQWRLTSSFDVVPEDYLIGYDHYSNRNHTNGSALHHG